MILWTFKAEFADLSDQALDGSRISSVSERGQLVCPELGTLHPRHPCRLKLREAFGIRLQAADDLGHGFSAFERLAHFPDKFFSFSLEQKLENAERFGIVGHVP